MKINFVNTREYSLTAVPTALPIVSNVVFNAKRTGMSISYFVILYRCPGTFFQEPRIENTRTRNMCSGGVKFDLENSFVIRRSFILAILCISHSEFFLLYYLLYDPVCFAFHSLFLRILSRCSFCLAISLDAYPARNRTQDAISSRTPASSSRSFSLSIPHHLPPPLQPSFLPVSGDTLLSYVRELRLARGHDISYL